MFRLSFYPVFGNYWVVLGIVLVLLTVLLTIRPDGERLSARGRRFLILLRFAALLLLLLALLRPTLVYTKTERLSSTLNILLDVSESMSRPDEAGGATRFQAATDSLLNAQPKLKNLQKHTEVHCFAFDAELRPLAVKDGIVENVPKMPEGSETAIGAALDAVRERSFGSRVLGTILFSDGNQRTRPPRDALPQDAAVRLRDAGMPLYTIALGRASGTPDIQDVAVNDIRANDRVFVRNELLIEGSVRIAGYRNEAVPIRLLFEDENGAMQVVDEKTIRAREDGQVVPFRFAYAPQKTGYFKYTVSVPPLPKELIETNNSQSNFVRVVDGGLKVLFLQGERHYEQGPLKQSLDASADIHVDYLPVRVGKIGAGAGKGQSFQRRLELFTRERQPLGAYFEPKAYNAYILDNLDAKAFKPAELQMLADRVRDGCGLIMLGGYHAFGPGGYAETPIADVSPVELRAVDRQPLDGPIRRDVHWSGPVPMLPTELGRGHFVMRLTSNPAQNEEHWKSLPSLLGANRFDNPKPGATVLARGAEERQILLVSHLFGLGRVLAFAGDSTYRWRLAGFVEEHKRFWRQIVLWLAKMEGVLEGDCWVTLENVRLLPGDAAKFHVFLQSPEGEELRNFSAQAFVRRPDGTEERVSLVEEEGIPSGTFRATETPGDYAIRVEATVPGETRLRRADARFMVVDRNLELDNPIAYPNLLSNISETTGGQALAPERFGSLLDKLAEQSEQLIERRETKETLYDGWGLLLAFVAALGLDWFLRKYWGLV